MINAITTKLEVDVMQANELDQAVQLAVIHSLPAIVIHPQLVSEAILNRVRRRGQFKIITTVDWPKGDTFGMNKLRGLTRDMMDTDGYEIIVTGGKNENEARTEARVITDFIRNNLSQNIEVRFVLEALTRDENDVLQSAMVMRDIRGPVLLRTDHHLKVQVTKANIKTHTVLMTELRKVCGLPIKVSGNIDSIRTIAGCLQGPYPASKFAVNLPQLTQIIKELQKQPDELQELLKSNAEVTDNIQAITAGT